jgi:hypothetical protein
MPAMKALLGLVGTVGMVAGTAAFGQAAATLNNSNIGTLSANIGSPMTDTATVANSVTINFVDGMAMLGGHPLVPGEGGTEMLAAGKILQTAAGKVELLLQPGVFLRLDDHSAVMLVEKTDSRLEIELERGRAEVEVDKIAKSDYLLIDQRDGGTQIEKNGLYGFDANKNTMRVFDGEAAVFGGTGNVGAERAVTVKGGHEVAVTAAPGKPEEFDREQVAAKDLLYQWSSDRARDVASSEYGGGGGVVPEYEPGFYPYPYYAYGYYPYGLYPYYGFYGPAFYGGYGFGFGGYYGGYYGGFHGGGFHGGGGRR